MRAGVGAYGLAILLLAFSTGCVERELAEDQPPPPIAAPIAASGAASGASAAAGPAQPGGTADSTSNFVPGSALVEAGGGTAVAGPHDTLAAIARRSGLPTVAIIDANHLVVPYRLHPGQRLTLPRIAVHTVRPGETLYGVARRYNVQAMAVARLNHLMPPYFIKRGLPLMLPASAARNGTASPVLLSRAAPPASAPIPLRPLRSAAPASPALAIPPSAATLGSVATTRAESDAQPETGSGSETAAATDESSTTGDTVSAAPVAPRSSIEATPLAPLPGTAPAPSAGVGPAGAQRNLAARASAPMPSSPAPPPSPAPPRSPAPDSPRAVAAAVQAHRPPTDPIFYWPVHGRIVSVFGGLGAGAASGARNDGINIEAPEGTTVSAADGGVVAYAGNGLRGFGNLVLIKHDDGWVSAYAHNHVLLVQKGQRVRRGQPIARVGSTGGVATPQLHFELRQGVTAMDPLDHLPALTPSAG